jgi:hypothetical protein
MGDDPSCRPISIPDLIFKQRIGHGTAMSRRKAPESCIKIRAIRTEGAALPQEGSGATLKKGRRECRALDAPAALRAKMESTQASHTGLTRHSPRNGFTVSFVLSPATGFLATVASGVVSANLTPASGRHDHTTSPSASRAVRRRHHRRPPHPAAHIRDDRETPLKRRRDARDKEMIWGRWKQKYF